MGLLNNFLRRKQKKEQLAKIGEKQSAPVLVAKPAGESKAKEVKVKLANHSLAYKILVKPLVTEKSAIAESKNKYSFVVVKSANKNQIKTAIAEVYGVKPLHVNVANMEGRRVRFGKSMGRRNDYKKAIITLPAGKSIDIHSGV
ncbi:MAG: 50S ribosomal protein L23 [Candidatus Magasanikbacteria bacterium GW2011_GWA2_40_10]|uniref:Large ribosomal subunit protein uL23 n=1 Tax=Candidatus Magasanikbacteria bacterium GW2011_GWA2_40_10 TaxID=1619037 RepID=A0A0G0QCW7_9BACT|nr:MAG: 50S ribosomal protein L23 [Candidatus Magasanikbacteria bacterium GW2011_GWA2_40_10]